MTPLLTIREAARFIGLSRFDVTEAIRRGELAHMAPRPKRILIRPDALKRWAESKERGKGVA